MTRTETPRLILDRLLLGQQIVLATAFARDGRGILEEVMRIAPRAGEVTPRLTLGRITSEAGGQVQLVTDERGLRGRRADLVVVAGLRRPGFPPADDVVRALGAEIHWAIR